MILYCNSESCIWNFHGRCDRDVASVEERSTRDGRTFLKCVDYENRDDEEEED